jgi:hypothetical protein
MPRMASKIALRTLLIKTEIEGEERDCVRLTVQDTGVGFGPSGVERLLGAFHHQERRHGDRTVGQSFHCRRSRRPTCGRRE